MADASDKHSSSGDLKEESVVMTSVPENSSEVCVTKPELAEISAVKPLHEELPEVLPHPKPETQEVRSPKPSEEMSREFLAPISSEKSSEVIPLKGKPSEIVASEPSEAPAVHAPLGQYRLFNRQKTIHEVLGGGRAADVILWRKRSICIAILVAGGSIWFLFEQSGYTFLSVLANSLLLLVSVLFIWANAASVLQRPPPPLPDLTITEETTMIIASSMCKKINSVLAVARNIAIGSDAKLFLKVAGTLCAISILGGWFNFLTLAYLCLVLCLSIPALYNKYEDKVDKNAEIAHQHIQKHYKSLNENVLSKIPRRLSMLKAKSQ
uniref:Reticulon-like protein n=1 Tax=Araucaria cunninghamii TaxID=56994 RepID=A0A0D6R7P5_ARACU